MALFLLHAGIVRIGCGGNIRIFATMQLLFLLPTIIKISLKQLLHTFLSQQQHVFLLVLILTGRRNLFAVVDILCNRLRNKRSLRVLLHQLRPREVLKPRMLLNLDHAILTSETRRRLPLDHLHYFLLTWLMKSIA